MCIHSGSPLIKGNQGNSGGWAAGGWYPPLRRRCRRLFWVIL